jgi:hypothetical protein
VTTRCKGPAAGLGGGSVITSRATSRVRASARRSGRVAAISARASARERGTGSAPSAVPMRAISAK